jgi:hypothetical protein
MSRLWCAVLAVVLSSSAFARIPDGNGTGDDKKASDGTRTKSLEELNADLEAQKIELDAQKAQIQALLEGKNAAMSLEGKGALPEPQEKKEMPDVKSKWNLTIYGFVEADFIEDSKQEGTGDTFGNAVLIPGHGTYATEHNQLTFGVRNSRIGLNGSAPEFAGFRASAKLEMDFEGINGGATAANPGGGAVGSGSGEANATWTNPTFRIRHMFVKLESDVVTFTIGQSWELMGWQPYFMPDTVDIQGVAGEVYSRSTKFQVSHDFKGPLDIEIAAAASRPIERDSNTPDLQAGVKFAIPDWVGYHSIGAAGGSIDAAAIGLSACYRGFRVPRPGGILLSDSASARGDAACLDIFLPILHPDKESRANSLSFTGETLYGKGINDLYTGFTGGAGGIPGITDAGYVGWDQQSLKAVQWRTTMLGLQYYLPGDGNWWVALNYSACKSDNMSRLATAPFAVGTPTPIATSFGGANGTTAFKASQWLNANLFWDITPAVRFGASLDQYRDTYAGADNPASAILFLTNPLSREVRETHFQVSVFYIF